MAVQITNYSSSTIRVVIDAGASTLTYDILKHYLTLGYPGEPTLTLYWHQYELDDNHRRLDNDFNDVTVPTCTSAADLGSQVQAFIDTIYASGTVTSVGLAAGTSGTDVNITGSPVTTSGTITINIPSASETARGLVTTGTQTFAGAKTFNNDVTIGEDLILTQNSSGITGNNADLNVPPSTNIRLTNGGLVSLASINTTGVVTGHQIWLHNDTGNTIIIINNYGAAPAGSRPILTTLSSNIHIPHQSSIIVEYDSTDSAWRLVGNVGFADATYPGYLSSTDWSTFNNKQSALTLPLSIANGGTNKALTLVNGGVVWSDADSFEITAAGTSGQYLMSNGAAAPSWADPTRVYILSFTGGGYSPADGQYYFFDNSTFATQTVEDNLGRCYIPVTGTIIYAQVAVRVGGTLGSAEDITFNLRLNGSTNMTITSVGRMTTAKGLIYSNTFSQAVTAGVDFIQGKQVEKVFATNPTSVYLSWTIVIKPT